MKRFSVEKRTKGGIEASGGIRALVRTLSLSILNLLTGPWPPSLSCSPVGLAGGLMQGLRQV